MWKTTLGALAMLTVTLGLAACGGSETSTEPAAPPATTQEPAAPVTTEEPAPPAATTEAAQPETEAAQPETETTQSGAAGATVAVEVKGGQPVGGPKELTVSKGDRVTIEVSVDAPQEIHVHGYDVEAEATPAKPGVIKLTADLEGVFDVESHTSEALLVKLVVEP